MYPNISVAFLTYNRSKTSIKSLRSVVSDPNVTDIVIFDDGSDANEIGLIQKFAKNNKKISIRTNKKNLGYQINLSKALKYLSTKDSDLLFLCESDMLLSFGWGNSINEAFKISTESVALSAMLHRDQMRKNRSAIFQSRSLTGYDPRYPENKHNKPFGTRCYTQMPSDQEYLKLNRHTIKFVSNSVGSLIFKKSALKKIFLNINKLKDHVNDEDAWLSYMCFKVNNFNPKSLMVLDPGIALTFGEPGLHGHMFLNNLRWDGSFAWRNKTLAFLIRRYYLLIYSPYIINRFAISRKNKLINLINRNLRLLK